MERRGVVSIGFICIEVVRVDVKQHEWLARGQLRYDDSKDATILE